ncbi:MAG: phosphotransferase [Rhodospirillales bacterium]
MADRAHLIAAFLTAQGWAGADRYPLPGDASFRRYVRLQDKHRSALLMDAPPPLESVQPFVRLARHLRSLGLSAPAVYGEDLAHGLLLIEDFGEETFTRLLAGGVDEESLYALALDVLIDLHRKPTAQAIPKGLAPYDAARLLEEALLFLDWYLPAVGAPVSDEVRGHFIRAWLGTFPLLGGQRPALVLRDYHVDNLMRLTDRTGIAACGLLDFQDALAGPAVYDVMSLLEDARRDIPEALKAEMLERYLSAFDALDRAAFEAAFAVLGAQRHAKVIGIFTRLHRRDGKQGYLPHIPRVWRMLERSLAHPVLGAVAAWFERHVPAEKRMIPPTDTMRQP